MRGPQGKARQVKKEQWKGFRDSGTPHRAGENKRQLEREGWVDVSGQMQQQQGWWPKAGQAVFRRARLTARGRTAGVRPPGLPALCARAQHTLSSRCGARAGPQPARCSPGQRPSGSQSGSRVPARPVLSPPPALPKCSRFTAPQPRPSCLVQGQKKH